MFEEYPKKRRELPEQFRKIYSEHYKMNREGKTTASAMSQWMESWLHRKVASDLKNSIPGSTLEIGAGTLNQLKYENSGPYDIVEPFKELYQDSPYKERIRQFYHDIDEIDHNMKYQRITSIATFEHITDLPKVVAKSCLLLKPSGTMRVSIPNEGTFLWKLGWKLTTGLEFRIKWGLDYGILLKHEHVNTAEEIESVMKYFFGKIRCSCLGLGKRFAFYRFYECVQPDLDRVRDYLNLVKCQD